MPSTTTASTAPPTSTGSSRGARGDQKPHTTAIGDLSHAEASEGSQEAHSKVYEIALDEDDTDAFYQSKTNWLFVPWAQPYQEAGLFFDRGTVDFRMKVTAFRG